MKLNGSNSAGNNKYILVLARQYSYMGANGEYRLFRRSDKPSVKLVFNCF